MSRVALPACQGSPRCSLSAVAIPSALVPCRTRFLTPAQRQPLCPGLLLSPQPGRRSGLCVFASSQKASKAPEASLLAPLPQWCRRLAGAFVLVPLLVFGGSRNAVAHPVRPSLGQGHFQAASVRANPLYETGISAVRTLPQARTAAALAAAMVGYGFVRSGGTGSAASAAGGGGSFRAAASAAAAAAADASAVSAPPEDATICAEELQRLSKRLLELERRNELLLARARELMEADSSLGFVEATFKAAESLDMDATAAAEFIVSNASTARLPPPSRPSGGAPRGATIGVVTAAAATAAAADVMAAAAAAVAAEVHAGAQMRPSGGASRLVPPSSGPFRSDSRVPMPERPGGASVRNGPPAPPPPRPDSSRVPPDLDLDAWAAEAFKASDPVSPPPPGVAAPPSAGGASGQVYDNPLADGFRPSFRPARRGPPPRAPRMYRAITPPPLPLPPAPVPRVNPSFDVPEDSPSPEDYLAEADGRTADGRLNPSFASASAVAGEHAVTELPTPPPPPATPTQSAWYNPLSWFTQRGSEAEGSRAGTNPSFDSSLAVDVATGAEQQQQLQVLHEQGELQQEEEQGQQELQLLLLQELEGEQQGQPMEVEMVAEEVEVKPEVEAEMSLVISLVQAAEEQAEATGEEVGVGAAAAASSTAWFEALTEGASLTEDGGDYTPVEQVVKLLQVAMRTEEFTYPKYDPLRNALADATAPSGEHKYDMLRGLLRAGNETSEEDSGLAAAGGEGHPLPQPHKYDLIYDLLQSVHTSGDPDVILAAGDPKYDPVWCLLNMRAPTHGSLTKYDLVTALIQAALEASPQPNRYDPLQVILQARPITGSFKYCIAEVLLRGGWQQPLESGLVDLLPSWDPLTAVVGRAARQTATSPFPPTSAGLATGGPRTVSKYDMVGQALAAAASLPEDLASGKWAASQPRDLILGRRPRAVVPRRRQQRRSKYDMVGQALEAAAALPEELASGRWAASQGRELFLDTMSRAVDEGDLGLWRRLRNGSAAALGAVTAVVSPVGNFVAKAVGLPYEVAPGVVMKIERLEAELPTVVYQFRQLPATSNGFNVSDGRSGGGGVMGNEGEAATGFAASPWKRQQRTAAVEMLQSGPAEAEAAVATPPASQLLERSVVPLLRGSGRDVASSQHQPEAEAVPLSDLPFDTEVLQAAASDRESVLESSSLTSHRGSSGVAAAAAAATTEAASAEAATAATTAATVAVPPPSPMSLSDLAVDLMVVMSVLGGGDVPSTEELVARFGEGFTEVVAQLQSLRGNGSLMSRHSAVARVVRAASKAPGDGKSMWSHLYDMAGAVREAELAMPTFLEDCRMPYPLVHELLTTGDVGQSVSVLCALCNLIPLSADDGSGEQQ